jgi:hypothetical protein
MFDIFEIKSDAYISSCGRYRYWLSRVWNDSKPLVCWVLLNPSTADHRKDDPTIRRCMSFAKQWKAGGIVVVNLFALRATNPKELYLSPDPIGPENDDTIMRYASGNCKVVAGWGVHGGYLNREVDIIKMMNSHEVELECLGVTKGSHPKHPLYVSTDTKLVPFN